VQVFLAESVSSCWGEASAWGQRPSPWQEAAVWPASRLLSRPGPAAETASNLPFVGTEQK